jgi:hypothetical protein
MINPYVVKSLDTQAKALTAALQHTQCLRKDFGFEGLGNADLRYLLTLDIRKIIDDIHDQYITIS